MTEPEVEADEATAGGADELDAEQYVEDLTDAAAEVTDDLLDKAGLDSLDDYYRVMTSGELVHETVEINAHVHPVELAVALRLLDVTGNPEDPKSVVVRTRLMAALLRGVEDDEAREDLVAVIA